MNAQASTRNNDTHPQRDITALKEHAIALREKILRTLHRAGSGHPGGSLSCVEILMVLYRCIMKHRPHEPQWPERDRLIISKGHASAAAYVVLADCGYFPESELERYRTFGSMLQGHVSRDVPGIEFSTGSLGHGLSVANGIALGARMKQMDFDVYCLLGDGEIQEGSIWEAAMSAAHHKLDRVCAVVDYNKVQENGPVNTIKNLEPLASKWDSFGWRVIEIDGHDIHELLAAFDEFKHTQGRPTCIIAHTVKGKGVSFMEGQARWHGKAPDKETLERALEELKEQRRRLLEGGT